VRRLRFYLLTLLLLPIWALRSPAQPAVRFENLVSFAGTNGSTPMGNLVQGPDGTFYGVAQTGGNSDNGTIFKMSADGNLTTLFSFAGTNGSAPHLGLTFGPDGSLYGTTSLGGAYNMGTVFKISPGGAFTLLFSFAGTNGFQPAAELTLASDGNFYGSTDVGGSQNWGTFFRISPAGFFTLLSSLDSISNACPYAAFAQGKDGALYTTSFSSQPTPTFLRLTLDGTFSAQPFDGTNGSGSHFPMVIAQDGVFYGSGLGGANRDSSGWYCLGQIFRVTCAGEAQSVCNFSGTNGCLPRGIILARDGNIYGQTGFGGSGYNGDWLSGNGTVFQVTPAGRLTTLVSFTNQARPFGGLSEAADGYLYGTTCTGGDYGLGSVFRVIVPMAPVFQSVAHSSHGLTLTSSAVSGFTYKLQCQSASTTGAWNNLGPAITATTGLITFSDPDTSSAPLKLYRVVLISQ
jgi:uncharacterized repeat protein (TIGR03803 family)